MASDTLVGMVEVTVAPRRSIQTREPGKQAMVHRAGSKVFVPKTDLERLVKQGFCIDPSARKLTEEEIAAADPTAYLPKSGDVQISEDSDQKIQQGKASGKRAA